MITGKRSFQKKESVSTTITGSTRKKKLHNKRNKSEINWLRLLIFVFQNKLYFARYYNFWLTKAYFDCFYITKLIALLMAMTVKLFSLFPIVLWSYCFTHFKIVIVFNYCCRMIETIYWVKILTKLYLIFIF